MRAQARTTNKMRTEENKAEASAVVACELCPKACVIAPGQSGECRIRVNIDGKLVAVTYGYPCSAHIDPVEKKPLFHFLPGTPILSIATVGCNLHCKNCQNWEISQENPENLTARELPPEAMATLARRHNCLSVAYTYTEPLAYYEYTLGSCMRVHDAGLKNVLVTAGYINRPPLEKLCRYVDAANIDLKFMSDKLYREIAEGTLKPVQNTLVTAREMGVMVEVTNLVIPTLNDSDADLAKLTRWLVENLGPETPLHFSRFFRHSRMRNLPPTPPATLERATEIARAEGLRHVYVGNISIPNGENTYCPGCGALLIERVRYSINRKRLVDGKCPECGKKVHGVWS